MDKEDQVLTPETTESSSDSKENETEKKGGQEEEFEEPEEVDHNEIKVPLPPEENMEAFYQDLKNQDANELNETFKKFDSLLINPLERTYHQISKESIIKQRKHQKFIEVEIEELKKQNTDSVVPKN